MSKFFIHEGLLCRSYALTHIRRPATYRDQLVVPQSNLSLMHVMTYPYTVVISPLWALSRKYVTVTGGQPCILMSYVISKVVRHVKPQNIASATQGTHWPPLCHQTLPVRCCGPCSTPDFVLRSPLHTIRDRSYTVCHFDSNKKYTSYYSSCP